MEKDKHQERIINNNYALAKELNEERMKHKKTIVELNKVSIVLAVERQKYFQLQKQLTAIHMERKKERQFVIEKLGNTAKDLQEITVFFNPDRIWSVFENETKPTESRSKAATNEIKRRKSSGEFAMPKIEEESQTDSTPIVDSQSETIAEPAHMSMCSASRAATTSTPHSKLSQTTTDGTNMTNDSSLHAVDRPFINLFNESDLSIIFDPATSTENPMPLPIAMIKSEPATMKSKSPLPHSTSGTSDVKRSGKEKTSNRRDDGCSKTTAASADRTFGLKTTNTRNDANKLPIEKKSSAATKSIGVVVDGAKQSSTNEADSAAVAAGNGMQQRLPPNSTASNVDDQYRERTKRKRKSISYKEPSLNAKMRRK